MAKTALVISGGGSKGAFAVGALSYIHANVRPIDQFDIYCGTSTGSLIVPLAAIGEMNLLTQVYTTTQESQVINIGGIANLLRQVSLHDASPLKNLIETSLTNDRYNRLIATRKPVFLATVCLQTERLVYFSMQPGTSTANYDVQVVQTLTDLQRAMLASSCQPVFMQPVEWRPGAVPIRQYADGGVRELTPFQAAVDNGAEVIISITNSPVQTPADNQLITSAISMLGRTIDLFSEDVNNNDYRLTELYSRTNGYLHSVRQQLQAQGVAPAIINAAFASAVSPTGTTAVRQLVDIRPATKLDEGGPGGLTFNPPLMQQMFQKGVAAAKATFAQVPAGAIA